MKKKIYGVLRRYERKVNSVLALSDQKVKKIGGERVGLRGKLLE